MTAEATKEMLAAGTPPFWHKPNTTGQFPCPRCAHTTFFFDMKFFVLGGWNGHRMLNDLYALCMPQMRWVKVSTTGDPPSPRTGHATLVVGSKLILFGLCFPFLSFAPLLRVLISPCFAWGSNNTGGDDGVGYLNDLYILDLETFVWARGFSTGTTPCARSRHTMVAIDGEHLVVFGGGDDTRVYNDLYLFDTAKMFWSRIAPTYGVSVALGGAGGAGDAAGASLAVSAGGFSHSAHVPAPRWGHAAVVVAPGKFVVFGGHDGSSMLNDVWLFDAMLCCWTQIHPRSAAAAPSPRAGHVMSAVPGPAGSTSSTVVIFGGGDSEQVLNDIYLLVPVNPEHDTLSNNSHNHQQQQQQQSQQQSQQQQGYSASAVAAMIRSTQITYRWVKGPFNRDANPLPRCAHSVCTVPMRAVAQSFTPFESSPAAVDAASALVIFAGGDSTRRLKDIFFLDVPHLLHVVEEQQSAAAAAAASATGAAGGSGSGAADGTGKGTAQGGNGLGTAGVGASGGNNSSSGTGGSNTGISGNGNNITGGTTEEQLSKAAAALVGTAPAPAGVTAMNAFLKSVGFEAYAPVFAREEVTIETLPLLSERHLEALGVASLGVRLRMLAAIRKRYGHTSSLQQSRSQPSTASTAAPAAEREDIAALTAATRQLQKSTEALTKAVTLIATMLQQQSGAVAEEVKSTVDEAEKSTDGDKEASSSVAAEGDSKDDAPPSQASTEATTTEEQTESSPEQVEQQQQQQKKKSRRNKSKSKGVSLAAHTGAGATGAGGEPPAMSPLVHVNDSRLVLQQPMPNPFVRNATQPYAPLLHPQKDSATDGC